MPLYRLDGHSPKLEEDVFVAPDASVIGQVELRARANVWFSAVIRADNDLIVVGRDSNVQDGAVLHTDAGIHLVVGDRVTVGHKVMLHGCTIGEGSLIGIGSVVMNHARIGARSIVAAGALVTEGKEFPDGVLVMGSPARVKRELTPVELEHLAFASKHYVEQAARYRKSLTAM